MTYRAVVKYPVGAEPKVKITEIKDGLVECAHELFDLGLSEDAIVDAFESAVQHAAFEHFHDSK